MPPGRTVVKLEIFFHYALTMLRSLVKLEWNMDYQELCKAINFETPKALFMQEKEI